MKHRIFDIICSSFVSAVLIFLYFNTKEIKIFECANIKIYETDNNYCYISDLDNNNINVIDCNQRVEIIYKVCYKKQNYKKIVAKNKKPIIID